jgi:hypothetical protein
MSFSHWIGVVILAAMLGFLTREDLKLLRRRRAHTEGTVTGHRRSLDDGSEYYVAQVRFTTEDGRSIDFDDTFGRSTPTPPAGARVRVLYATEDPSQARVVRWGLRPLIYCIVLAMLALLVASGLGFVR